MEYFITSENLIKEIKSFYEDHQSFFDKNKEYFARLFKMDVRFILDEKGMYVKTSLKADEGIVQNFTTKMQQDLGRMPLGYTVVDMI